MPRRSAGEPFDTTTASEMFETDTLTLESCQLLIDPDGTPEKVHPVNREPEKPTRP
jgi:hypothetical protein